MFGKILRPWEKRRLSLPRRRQDTRNESDKDFARIIHSAGFRRLQGKTQLLGIGEGDFHRTRLTHSLEAAQIGRGLVQVLRSRFASKAELISPTVVEAACLAHDIGHPPFGHGGEVALNYAMRNHGGFEGNGQTLRLLAKLESHSGEYGLNLTRRTLLATLKYPLPFSEVNNLPVRLKKVKEVDRLKIRMADWKPPKCYLDSELELVDWILKPLSRSDRKRFRQKKGRGKDWHPKPTERSLDASIMEIADDIAYGVHDLEDVIALHLVDRDIVASAIRKADKRWKYQWGIGSTAQDLFIAERRKYAVGTLVNALINSIEIRKLPQYDHPLLGNRAYLTTPARDFVDSLQNIIEEEVLKGPELRTLEYRGQVMLIQLFDAVASDPGKLMKKGFSDAWRAESTEAGQMRTICDYISGMTDEYAIRIYERMFVPRARTIFERL